MILIGIAICFLIGGFIVWLSTSRDCTSHDGYHHWGQWEMTKDCAPPGKFTHRRTQIRHCSVCNKAQHNYL